MENPFRTRSTVYSTKGMVSSPQPLANAAGIKILEKGGNCVDACVAIAACLCVVEPMSTGIGGDCFALFYNDKDKNVYGMNGTGRSASALDISYIEKTRPGDILPTKRFKEDSVFKVQVPGAIAGWYDAVSKWGSGKVTFSDCLQPAIELAEGYVVSQVSCAMWADAVDKLAGENAPGPDLENFLPHGKAPKPGQYLKNHDLAETLRIIAAQGKRGFYQSQVSQSIVDELNRRGHPMTLKDLASHESTFVKPISYEFLGHKLWEIPPSGSGIVALLTLGLIDNLNKSGRLELKSMEHNSVEYLHMVIETLKIAFRDSDACVNDWQYFLNQYGIDESKDAAALLGDEFLSENCKQFDPTRLTPNKDLEGVPNSMFKSDTVYFNATDSDGNACSFINSLYEMFGSGIIVPKYGFTLQNRGGNFNLNPDSRNFLQGNKRSYHTIIPGMITTPLGETEELYATYGIMGGYNQPQAHVQVYMNMLLFGMSPQDALDAPRICLFANPDTTSTDRGQGADGPVSNDYTCVGVEPQLDPKIVSGLRAIGHDVRVVSGNDREIFGRGQIIRKDSKNGCQLVYAAGSDPRGDGASVPFSI